MSRVEHDFDDDMIEEILDFVELVLDGEDGKAQTIVEGWSTRQCGRVWSVLDAMTDVVAEHIQPYGPD